jgi:glycosyltransferase involved in cell wall biosynthesis
MNDGPRRILYIDSCIGLAGGQYSLIEILKTLDRSRFIPLVASPPGSGLRRRCEALPVRWLPLPFESAHLSCDVGTSTAARIKDAGRSLGGVRYLAETAMREQIDLVHTNNFKAALVGCFAALAAGRPLVSHDRIHIAHEPLGTLVALLSRRIIAVSETVAAKHRWPVRNKIRIIPPGIDVDHYSPVVQDESSRKTESGGRVCYIGRVCEEKDLGSLIEAAAKVAKHVAGVRFVIAGSPFTVDDGAYLEKIKRLVGELGLAGTVEFAGYVEDVKGLLEDCDALVLPSRKEPLGRVMLEAMAMEKPVIAFAVGGPKEVIRDGTDGSGRVVVTSAFSSEAVTERIMDVYDEILGGRCGDQAR